MTGKGWKELGKYTETLVCLCNIVLLCDNAHTLHGRLSILLNFTSCNFVTSAQIVERPEDNFITIQEFRNSVERDMHELREITQRKSQILLICILSSLNLVDKDQVFLPFTWASCKSIFF